MQGFDFSKIVSFPEMLSAQNLIKNMAGQIQAWQETVPEDQVLVVTLTAPDGRTMLVKTIAPLGHSGYVADGFIDELKCKVVGHISTLAVFCATEPSRGKAQRFVGFIPSSITEPPSESEPES